MWCPLEDRQHRRRSCSGICFLILERQELEIACKACSIVIYQVAKRVHCPRRSPKADKQKGPQAAKRAAGGSAVASDSIYREVLRVRESGKPVVVSMGNVSASGGYYISAPATKIVASPGTITGSSFKPSRPLDCCCCIFALGGAGSAGQPGIGRSCTVILPFCLSAGSIGVAFGKFNFDGLLRYEVLCFAQAPQVP